jgi:hypothetical protein
MGDSFQIEMRVRGRVLGKGEILSFWPWLSKGLGEYREKSPHEVAADDQLYDDWCSPSGDEVFAFGTPEGFAGYMTFKVAQVDGERWGTIGVIWLEKRFRHTPVLGLAADILAKELRSRGCDVMNFMTARAGFWRLAPTLGFKPRLVEWRREL